MRPRRTPTPSTRRNWRRNPNLDGQLVANWVDVFAPAILTTLPAAWPEVLLVDSVEYRIGGGVKYGWSFHVFVAVGYERRPGAWFAQPVVWRMQAFPRRRTEEWETFFDSLPGTPRIVISDMATESRTAAATIFPRPGDPAPDIRMCEYHVKERIENALAPVMNQPTHLLVQALPRVFLTPQDWADFEQLVHATHAAGTPPLPLMVRWLRRWSADVGAQVATRPRSGPHSIAGVEETINKVRAPFDYRSSTFGNRPRMNLLLGLITLALRHEVDEVAWADRIRAALIAAGGRLGYQRPHDDPMGFPSLVY